MGAYVHIPSCTHKQKTKPTTCLTHTQYHQSQGGADIFFPVDFRLLRDLYRYLAQRDDRTQVRWWWKTDGEWSNLACHSCRPPTRS